MFFTPGIISIPYGAIKRSVLMLLLLSSVKFQFLMVRLKELLLCSYDKKDIEFQFLMVRLKDVGL